MTTAKVVETSVTVNNSPIQDYVHPTIKLNLLTSLCVEYSRTLTSFFEDFKFAYKSTNFYSKWPVCNFGQKHELQYFEKIAA